MRSALAGLILAVVCSTFVAPVSAATLEQEKAFITAYKNAFETKNEKKLHSFLYTKGADPRVLEFYKAMQSDRMSGTITKIDLVDLTPEQVQEAAEVKASPGSTGVRLPLKPVRKLVIRVVEGKSTSTSECFVAEIGGKLVIPVPVPVQ